jgi:hypothetical protein
MLAIISFKTFYIQPTTRKSKDLNIFVLYGREVRSLTQLDGQKLCRNRTEEVTGDQGKVHDVQLHRIPFKAQWLL